MARLRLGLAGLLLLVLAAIGSELGGFPASGTDVAWSEALETQIDRAHGRAEIAASAASLTAEEGDDEPDLADAIQARFPLRATDRIAAGWRITTHRHLRPRATGPPAISIV